MSEETMEYTPRVDRIRVFYHPPERLRMTVAEDRSFITVRPVWAAPLSRPNQYLSLLDEKGEQIVMLTDPAVLDAESQDALRAELHRRYMTPEVKRLVRVKSEHGAAYFTAETDRGEREFVVTSLQDNAIHVSDTHLLFIDVDGNRFEIPDIQRLDAHSRGLLGTIL